MLIANMLLSDAGSVTVNAEISGTPGSNLKTQALDEYWRDSNLTTYVVVDLGVNYANQSINWIGLWGLNASPTGTARVRGASSEANLTAAPTYNPHSGGNENIHAHADQANWSSVPYVHYIAAGQALRYWRLDIVDTSNIYGYVQANRVFVSSAWVPTLDAEFGWQRSLADESSVQTTEAGGWIRRYRAKRDGLSFSLTQKLKSEMYTKALNLGRRVGNVDDVVVCMDPANTTGSRHEETVLGRISEAYGIGQANHKVYKSQFTVVGAADPNQTRLPYLTWGSWGQQNWEDLDSNWETYQ